MKKPQAKLFILYTLTLLIAVSFAAGEGALMQPDASLASLQGHWIGKGPGGDCSLTISGNSLRFHAREDHWYETEIKIASDTEPKQLHATIVDAAAPGQGHIGEVVVAIFKVDNGTLKLATREDTAASPFSGPWERYADHYKFKKAE